MGTERIDVKKSIYNRNDRIADEVNRGMTEKRTLLINVMGAPGVGKTSVIRRVVEGLELPAAVIEGDIESDIDAVKLQKLGIEALQIHTGGACHIDAIIIENTLEKLSLDQKGILFIENIGNLVCPAEFNIGENVKVLIVTVAEGADKPYKYPLAFEKAAAIILNKADLLPHVDFDMEYFTKGVRALNKTAPIFLVSAKKGEGFYEVCAWLRAKL